MGGRTLLCTLEVQSGGGECTRRTFNVERAPRTLREVVELLRGQDLRLQRGAFDVSVSRGGTSALQKLLADKDVAKFFSSSQRDDVFFKVALEDRLGGLANSMLADDGLVHLRIYHLGSDVVTEKRFIPPRRGVREALAMAVRDAVPQPPPASVAIRLYAVGSDIGDQRLLRDEDAVNKLLRSCLATGSPCHLTYRFDDEGASKQITVPTPQENIDNHSKTNPPPHIGKVNTATPNNSSHVDEAKAPSEAAKHVDEAKAPSEAAKHVDEAKVSL
ncbi:uncharacterized protein Tco025E_01738 [Trypanosoma conorhini]|uniref:Uncharacterized protein n=1 Tax=Trypanosoma conorhini TaxID=83891 RepID=A0A422Q7T6_9TRYP|nr:uncharacterized protein Tco025E_01738 [Trypanosoma conorhini]RNF26033.1 hypothetical protein Tco025E_01738 [Trypanosoma conorhini]